ncbi:hypothetical protein CJZ34_24150 [Salmonella enterica subsp. enterica serovar Hadar]|nr:hypothetical protein CJZ34_24150 [Salmonella enterica subsp. enterica serovar Hadar]
MILTDKPLSFGYSVVDSHSSCRPVKAKTRRSGLSAGALRMPGTSEVAGDYSPAGSLTPQVRKL